VTISSAELNKIFDAFNSISSQMKEHSKEAQAIKETQAQILEVVGQLKLKTTKPFRRIWHRFTI
jgi:regulator of replication initiation timing